MWSELRSLMSNASPSFFRTATFTSVVALSLIAACSDSSNNPTGGPAPPGAPAAVPSGVFTYHNDNARTGQNLNESVLTPANVNPTTFGLLFSVPVDGQIYAQPLYVAGLNIGGQLRNAVFVATEHDSVYAFDADNPTSTPLWHTSFINPAAGITTVLSTDVNCTDLMPEIGITSTPVIDPSSSTLFVESKTKENGTYVHRIHALDVTTGVEKLSSVIQGGVPGTGDGNVSGIVSFNPHTQLQRPALLLSNGLLYVAFASHCDNGPYHGWVFAYDAHTLSQRAIFNTTPNGGLGGIWHSGGGPAADGSGNVFVITGNGTFDGPSPTGSNNFGDTFLKLTSGALTPSDFFTPFNQATLEANDQDLGSGAPLLLPDQSTGPPHLLVSAGKEGKIYLLNRDDMGKFQTGSDSQIVQSLPNAMGLLFGTPAYFQNTVYFFAANDSLKAFSLSNGQLGTSPVSTSRIGFAFPGATPVISANGANNGIVWALQTDQFGTNGPALLHAFLASDVSTELYNSNQNPSRDNPGPAVKFTVPTVFNGKVYVGTQTQLSVFGLLP
jgi:hypothetical protein